MPNRRLATAILPAQKTRLSLFLQLSANASLAVLLVAFVLGGHALAQDTTKPPDQTGQLPSNPEAQSDTGVGKEVTNTAMQPVKLYNLLDRKSIFFPDIAESTKPLSTGGKFKLFVDNSISVHSIGWAVLSSAVAQADNSPTGYEQGWDAYAKRFGSSMGRQASTEFFGTFILASALHEDPRFFPEVNPGFGHAVKYSVTRIFVTRNDGGRDVANVSGLVGPLMAEGLANVYWPDRNRSVGDTFLRYGLDLAVKAGGNLLREYWPTVYRKFRGTSSVKQVQ
jgi:hypothetical protein